MYRNLEAEMARQNINKKDLAKLLNITYGTVLLKMNGATGFSLLEAFKIQKKFFPNLGIDYLFEEAKESA